MDTTGFIGYRVFGNILFADDISEEDREAVRAAIKAFNAEDTALGGLYGKHLIFRAFDGISLHMEVVGYESAGQFVPFCKTENE